MQDSADVDLLQEFVKNHSETAFSILVQRHIDFVYSAALRQVKDPHMAQEVAQVVFIILAQKAASFGSGVVLAGWLFRTTRYAAADALKKEYRRQRREQETYMAAQLNEVDDQMQWEQLSPVLDEAIDGLGATDRDAILLRYFQGKSLMEVSTALGMTEDTARKRVARSLEKLRKYFGKRGMGTGAGAAALGAMLAGHSVQAAPAGVSSMVTSAALTKGAAVSTTTLPLLKSTLKTLAWAKAKTSILIGTAVLLTATTATVAVREIHTSSPSGEPVIEEITWITAGPETIDKIPAGLLIRPSKYTNGVAGFSKNDRIFCRSAPFKLMLEYAYEATDLAVEYPSDIPTNNFDFMVNLPRDNFAMLQAAISNRFGLVAHLEKKEKEVLVLNVKNANPPHIQPDNIINARVGAEPGRMSYQGSPIDPILHRAHVLSKQRIENRTGLKGNYNYEMSWTPNDFSSFKESLRENLGMELIPEQKRTEVLVVERVK